MTALHDVAMAGRVRRDLTTAQVLEPVGRTRARYYTAGPRFPQLALDIAHAPMTLTNPYTSNI